MALPIGDTDFGDQFTVRDGAPLRPGELLETHHRVVTSDFFATLGLDIVEGRPLNATDTATSPPTVVVSRHMAKQHWPGQSPLGRQVKRGGPDSQRPWMTIVGVAEDVRDSSLDAEIGNTWYLPYPQASTRWLRLVLRTTSEPLALVPAVRQAIWSVDPDQPIYGVTTVDDMVYGSLADERFNSVLLVLFASVGLLLAVLGLYGLMSYSVRQQSTEIGIRMALGAHAGEVWARILWQGATLTAMGLAIGIVLSFAVNRLFTSLLFEIGPFDPQTIAVMAVFLAGVAGLATCLPARWATRIDPAVVLRSL
jgi:putative ABC transport system permease protein